MDFLQLLNHLVQTSGFVNMTWQHLVMVVVACGLLYLAIGKKFEPLLLLPISFGVLLANIPNTGLMFDAQAEAQAALAYAMAYGDTTAIAQATATLASTPWYNSGILLVLYRGIQSVLFPSLIFLGIGAMTDFSPMLANPKCMILGVAGQVGIFAAFGFAALSGLFTPQQAAVIGMIGSADGPTTIFLASRLAPEIMGAVAVAAYSYMALLPFIQPPIMKALTTQKEREAKMDVLRTVSRTEKLVFPIAVTALVLMIAPEVAPLVGMFMLGNLFKVSGVVDRLSDTAQNALINIVTILLGVTVGATTNGETFLRLETLMIVVLGLAAFAMSTAGGVLLGKVMYYATGGKVNPLIGSAGVSALPMAARVSQQVGQQYNKSNFLLMHAMSGTVASVICSAIVAGLFVALFG